MKKILSILFCLLSLSSCIKDDLSNCPGIMYFHFSYMYGGTNSFFEEEKTDLTAHFYKIGNNIKYRKLDVKRDEITIQQPFSVEKTLEDVDSLEFISWSCDENLEYIGTSETPLGEGYLHLKEMKVGSGICRPVNDLFYGRVKFDAEKRDQSNDISVPFVRAVCRIKITMIPRTIISSNGTIVNPNPTDYVFHVMGTRNKIDDNNITGGENIILQPSSYYDSTSGNIITGWFGAFGSKEKEYLKIDVYVHERKMASFDFTDNEITSVPGRFLDLEIDMRYIRPIMEVYVNGWNVKPIASNL